MPSDIDKTLYPAPQGIDALPSEPDMGDDIVVVLEAEDGEDEEAIAFNADGTPITDKDSEAGTPEFNENLATTLDNEELAQIVTTLSHDIGQDISGRSDWEKTYVDGLSLLGLKIEERTQPWKGACGVFHPMVTEAVVRFQAECITETFPAQGPVRGKVIGKETVEKKDACKRVVEDMNHQLTEVMTEYRSEHERMLWNLPAVGSAFKKAYHDPALGRQVSIFLPAEDVVLPYGTTDMDSCHRITHVMRKTKNELTKSMESGFYKKHTLGEPPKQAEDVKVAKDKETGFTDLADERFTLYEVHVDLVVKGDRLRDEKSEVAYPYVVTFQKDTNTVCAIRRNWREEDKLRIKRQHFVHYQYIPGFGAYGYGLFHLIGGFAKSATSIMRQLVDSGTLANLPGGLKARGLRIKGDNTPIGPGEFRDVDVPGGTIQQNILPLPYKEPSATLFALLGNIVEEGRRFAATADMKISDMSAQAPVGTTLALLERQLKVMTAVQARVHAALRIEFKLLKELIRDSVDDEYTYEPATGKQSAKQADYDMVDVIPVSDPNAATLSQRVVQYQAIIQMAQMAPEIYDLPVLHRGMLEVLGIQNADKMVPLEEDLRPMDPVHENMRVLKSEPVKAFVHQDHNAHLAMHQMLMQDPMVMQGMGQNPKAQMIFAALQAHVAEHIAYAYLQQIESAMGTVLPAEGEAIPPEVERALSGMLAQAGQIVLQKNQQAAAAQAAQQAAQDPLLALQQAELRVKELTAQIAADKVRVDAANKADRIDLDRERLHAEMQEKGLRLGHEMAQDRLEHVANTTLEATRTGMEAARMKREGDQQQVDNQQAAQQAATAPAPPTHQGE
jgi:hypothetical protein